MDNSIENEALVRAFIGLQLAGAFSFLLMVGSALVLKSVKRHAIWFSFCISWIIFGLSYTLLSFAGRQFSTPSFGLCVTQAALVYSAPPLAGCTSLSLVSHLLLSIITALSQSAVKTSHKQFIRALVILPWLIWIAITIAFLVFGIRHADDVRLSFNGTYCLLVNTPISKVTSVFATAASVLIISAEVMIGVLLFKYRAIVDIFSQSVTMAIRIVIFTFLGMTAIVMGLVFTLTEQRGIQYDIVVAMLPPGTAFIFGTQLDLLYGWTCWRRRQDVGITSGTVLSLGTISHPLTSTNSSFFESASIPRAPNSTPVTEKMFV
ncbi:hypothetical protein BDQ12DRAFT_733211 [Crucibulum laeve]|uniref:G-protein coupled receptors family 2 profile 2 domain-containing protein n=1 Tax=Crucibulum laeve TaxID=68775 RepID=A0A5C3M921_9AGAR|nr:hypothetical protein BDQ12DRAFT_733211 [Crucibulum laeve]